MSRHDRALAIAADRPLLSADLATVTWLTGVVTDITSGPSPFSAPPLVLLDPSGEIAAIVNDDDAETAAANVTMRTFPGFAVEDVDREALAAQAALDALRGAREIACDLASLPGSLVACLVREGTEIIDVGHALRSARAVKDPDEIAAIRSAIALADAGQAATRRRLRPGVTELELWAEVLGSIESAAGERVPLLADFVSGPRTAEVGGPPGDRTVGEQDLLLADLVPRRAGYWADSCATVAVGDPPAHVVRGHAAAVEALERATEMLRPGTCTSEVDAVARGIIERGGGAYPHHTGHGLGLGYHEEPRIVPGGDRVLAPGMVVALEPGSYGDGWGVRVERVVLVGEDGPEVLSGHDIAL